MMRGVGVIFMGGRASRLGGISKADIRVGERTCFERVNSILASQFETVAFSVAERGANALPEIIDWPSSEGDGGVAFSVLAAVKWALDNEYDYVVTSPCDTPFLPRDFAFKLQDVSSEARSAVCVSDNQIHGLHAYWPISILENLKSIILKGRQRKIGRIHDLLGSRPIEFSTYPIDPFLNINTPQDIEKAEVLAEKFGL